MEDTEGPDLAVQTQLRGMVEQLVDAFDKNGVPATAFNPNHLATLSVYFAKFVRIEKQTPQNGLARWCWGLKRTVPGDSSESEDHLASQCLPRHYDDSGAPQLDVLEQAGQAIASAPVTCELCHVGLQGHDTLRQHCCKKHGSWAEARKRIFYIAEEAGHTPLLPWAKRNMAQSFQFFRKYSVPNSCNDWTAKAHNSTKV